MSNAKTTFYIPGSYRKMLNWLRAQEVDRTDSSIVRLLIKAEYERRGGPALEDVLDEEPPRSH